MKKNRKKQKLKLDVAKETKDIFEQQKLFWKFGIG